MPVDSMAKRLQTAKRETQRRDLLIILRNDYGHFLNVRVVRKAMADINHALSMRDLHFHLVYLEEKGFVDLQRVDVPEADERHIVEGVRITAAGIDLLDGRTGSGVAEF